MVMNYLMKCGRHAKIGRGRHTLLTRSRMRRSAFSSLSKHLSALLRRKTIRCENSCLEYNGKRYKLGRWVYRGPQARGGNTDSSASIATAFFSISVSLSLKHPAFVSRLTPLLTNSLSRQIRAGTEYRKS